MANNEIVGPGQAAQVTVVGGGQQYRPSVNYSMPVMQPRQRLDTPDVNVNGGSFNLDLSPIANALVRSSELEAKQAEKQAEQQLEGIYTSYAQDVNDIALQHQQGYLSSDAANARIRKRTDSILSMPGVDADKVKTLKAGFGGFSEDLLKSRATAIQNDEIEYRDSQIRALPEVNAAFRGLPYNMLARIYDTDSVNVVNMEVLEKNKRVATSPEEIQLIERQIEFLSTGQAESIALIEINKALKSLGEGAEINEQTTQYIQNAIVAKLSGKVNAQTAQRIAYQAMKKYYGGNLHIIKTMNAKAKEAYAKEMENNMTQKMTIASSRLYSSLPEETVNNIAKTQLLSKVGIPDTYFDPLNKDDMFSQVVSSIMKGVNGNTYTPAEPGALKNMSPQAISMVSKIVTSPVTQQFTAGSLLPFASVVSHSILDYARENPNEYYDVIKNYQDKAESSITAIADRIIKGNEQQVIWDEASTKQVAEDINQCQQDIRVCGAVGKLDREYNGELIKAADHLRGSIATDNIRYDETTGTIGMVTDSELEYIASQGEGAVVSALKGLIMKGLNGVVRLGKAATGNELQENMNTVNRILSGIPIKDRKQAASVLLHRDVRVLEKGETMQSTSNGFSTFAEAAGKALDSFGEYINTREKNNSIFGINKEDFKNNADFNKYSEPQKISGNTSIFGDTVNSATSNLIEGISTANERSRTFLEGIGDVAGELLGIKEAYGSEIENVTARDAGQKENEQSAKNFLDILEGGVDTVKNAYKRYDERRQEKAIDKLVKAEEEENFWNSIGDLDTPGYTAKEQEYIDNGGNDFAVYMVRVAKDQRRLRQESKKAREALLNSMADSVEKGVKGFYKGVGDVAGELFGFRDANGSEIENAPESVDVISAPKTEFEKYVNKKRELEKLRKDMGAMGLTEEVAETDKLLADLKHPDSDIVPGINGNISIRDREAIDLGNGEHGTELSITVEADGKHFVIPTIYKDKDGVTRQHTDEEAKEHFRSTGEFLHVEDDPKKAELMAFRIHDRERGGDVLKPYPEKFKPAIVVASNAAGIDIEDIRGKTFAETSDGKQFADSENVGWFQVGDAAAEDVMKDTKYVKKVKEIYPEFKGDKNNPIDNIFLGVGYMKKQEEEARRLFKKYNVPEDTLLEYAFVRYTANQKKLDKLLEKYGEDWIKDEHLISITKNKDNRYVNYIKNYRKAKEAALKGEIVKR